MRVLLPVGDDSNAQNLHQKGAPSYNALHSLLCILLISNVLLVLARHRRYHPTHLGYSTSILVVRHFRVIPGSRLPTRLTCLACRRSQIPRPTQARRPLARSICSTCAYRPSSYTLA